MYTIIGGDGREYGPVTAEQVRTWVAGGRANRDTKIKIAGTEEWKTVADFPEIVGGASAAEFSQPPAALSSMPLGSVPAVVGFDVMSCYERSWNLLKANFWLFVGAAVVMMLTYVALAIIQKFIPVVVTVLLGGPLGGGFYYFFLRKVRGEPATIGDLYSGLSRAFVPLMLAGILVQVFVLLGFVCLILPGIYLAVAYSMVYLLATDKLIGFWEAMEGSRKVITPHWWSVFGLLLLGIPFAILGLVCLGVGLFVAMPLIMGAVAYAYEDLFNPGH